MSKHHPTNPKVYPKTAAFEKWVSEQNWKNNYFNLCDCQLEFIQSIINDYEHGVADVEDIKVNGEGVTLDQYIEVVQDLLMGGLNWEG